MHLGDTSTRRWGDTDEVNEPGDDLVIAPGPGLRRGLVIPASELIERFSRSSGPGGQGVNTTDSRVELLFEPATSASLDDVQRERLSRALADRLVAGRISVVASEHRSQLRNRSAARARLSELLRTALAPPPAARRATKPTKGSQRRRLENKKRRSDLKSGRGRVTGE
ncbi:ribosome-associated protein [Humibacillus xanthopallidus]|uniref:Ribosome-associated protein n=1 Tax=Humibacillus xanthopallidus TaxID=412689 RepID=A0A543PQW0_9MICO|nr:ribosome-associated protein [Humibacillus xanthopallidus]